MGQVGYGVGSSVCGSVFSGWWHETDEQTDTESLSVQSEELEQWSRVEVRIDVRMEIDFREGPDQERDEARRKIDGKVKSYWFHWTWFNGRRNGTKFS